MKAEEYAEKYRELTGENPPDNVLEFYKTVGRYDDLNDRLDAIDVQIEQEKERQAIRQIERDGQKGIRIFRRLKK